MKLEMVISLMIMLFIKTCESKNSMWSMKDRFSGIRFEIYFKQSEMHCTDTVKETIKKHADRYACFGWVQNSSRGSVVGEARCNKQMGFHMKSLLYGAKGVKDSFGRKEDIRQRNKMVYSSDKNYKFYIDCVEGVEIKDYEDTKIKLHFSHFKILDSSRETCFRDTPHKCTHKLNLV